MKKESTATRLKQIMKERQLRQVDILEKCKPFCRKFDVKLGRNDLSQYLKYSRFAFLQMQKDIMPSSDYVIEGSANTETIVENIINIIM